MSMEALKCLASRICGYSGMVLIGLSTLSMVANDKFFNTNAPDHIEEWVLISIMISWPGGMLLLWVAHILGKKT